MPGHAEIQTWFCQMGLLVSEYYLVKMSVFQVLAAYWKLYSLIQHLLDQYLEGSQQVLGCHHMKILLLVLSASTLSLSTSILPLSPSSWC